MRLHGQGIARLQRLLDPLVLTLLFLGFDSGSRWVGIDRWFPFWALLPFASLLVLPDAGLYSSYRHRSLRTLIRRITTSWLLVLSLLLTAAFLSKSLGSFSRLDSSLWAFSGWLWLLSNHVLLRKWLRWHRRRGGNSRTIVYWGLPDAAEAFANQIAENPWMGLRIIAWFSPVPVRPDAHSQHCPSCSGGFRELREWLSDNTVDRLIFSHVTTDGLGMDQMVKLFGDTSLPVVYAPHWAHPTMRFTVDSIGSQPCIDLWGSERSLLDRQLKRGFDLILTSIVVLIISPV